MLCCFIVICSAAGTYTRNSTWKEKRVLAEDILDKNPASEQGICALAIEIQKSEGEEKALSFITGPEAENCEKGDLYHYTAAGLCYCLGRNDRAEAFCRNVSTIPRYIARARYIQGMTALRRYDEKNALAFLKQSLMHDRYYHYTYKALASFFGSRGNTRAAILYLNRLISFMPDNAKTNREFALLLYSLAKKKKKEGEPFAAQSLFTDSIAVLKYTIEKGSADKQMRLLYMDILIEAEYIKMARAFMDKLINAYPDDPAVIERCVRYYNNFIQYRMAEKLCEKLNRITGGEDLNAMFLLAEIYYKRRKLQQAESVLRQCLARSRDAGLHRQELTALNNLAKIDMYVGDYDEACRKYTDILNRDKAFWQAHAGLTEIYIKKGEFAKAEQGIAVLRKLVPKTYFARVKLESMLKRGKKHEQYRIRYKDQGSDG